MSWLQKLCETYDRCFGQEQFESNPLTPVNHTEQQIHVEVTVDRAGRFLRAEPVAKETTIIPATESSAGRTAGRVAHPLSDKIRYCGADYSPSGDKESLHPLYLGQLREWMSKEPTPKVGAVLAYIERGSLVQDLVSAGVLHADEDGKLLTQWVAAGEAPPIFRTLTAKAGKRDQGDAFVRWQVEMPDGLRYPLWKDEDVRRSWTRFVEAQENQFALCMVTGNETAIAASHPKRLRHGADGAKLISSNDSNGFTFRGRFDQAAEACGVGSMVTQKAHNALRWLIARQGVKQGDQVIVSWAISGAATPRITVSTEDLILNAKIDLPAVSEDLLSADSPSVGYEGDAGQGLAARLNKLIRGYAAQLGEHDDIIVTALDSATPGRMAVVYYRELQGAEFLQRIQKWHENMAWPQNLGKNRRFIGAPAPRDVAEASYGRRVDDKLQKATIERLLPCIVDVRSIPRDLVSSAVQRTTSRFGLKRSKNGFEEEFEFCLGVACSMVRGSRPEERYTMSLDEDRTTRDYLYGRLLAIAEDTESLALYVAKENRDTSAAKLMQRFADHPYTTWRTIELALRPYMSRLRGSRPGALVIRERMLDQVAGMFHKNIEGESEFLDNSRLSGEFLLGYHSQRASLRSHRAADPSTADITDTEGETS